MEVQYESPGAAYQGPKKSCSFTCQVPTPLPWQEQKQSEGNPSKADPYEAIVLAISKVHS